MVAVIAGLVLLAALITWMLLGAIPRRVVIATGAPEGMFHMLAVRYAEILAEDGVTLVERPSQGAGENLRLLQDAGSGVDVAFAQGGLAEGVRGPEMLATLFYDAMWGFYRRGQELNQLDQLRGKRIAVGPEGSGARVFVAPLLAANDVTAGNSTLLPLAHMPAVHALQKGEVDAVVLMGPAQTPAIDAALRDPGLELMSFARAAAYERRFPFIDKLVLPAGTIDLARDIPPRDVTLLGTKAMLVARAGLSDAIVDLLLDAARDVHAEPGFFEANSEFPTVERVDLPVSEAAIHHHRFGPRLLHRYMPFFMATFLERMIIVLLPLVVIIVPLMNLVPQLLRWRVRSRIYRWYGELALLEREVAQTVEAPPVERWLSDLDRIERAAERVRTPTSYAGEWYTLREHIAFVRRAVMAKATPATT